MSLYESGESTENLKVLKIKLIQKKSNKPAFLLVLTGSELSYIREDGVYVVSIGTLKN